MRDPIDWHTSLTARVAGSVRITIAEFAGMRTGRYQDHTKMVEELQNASGVDSCPPCAVELAVNPSSSR
jgi:hypothetical protein